MGPINADLPAAWAVDDLAGDASWIFTLDDDARHDLTRAARQAFDPGRSLLDYRRAGFDLGAAGPAIRRAVDVLRDGRGFALLRGLPRGGLSEREFELITWGIGLHIGVARPQGKASPFIAAVRDEGSVYRSAGGRGYSSSASLDFHVDSADIALLTCYNVAKSGGGSMVTSSVTAHNVMVRERPDLVELLRQPLCFSRQQEQAPHEGPYYTNPIWDAGDGHLCGKWNRNRLLQAQKLEGVPPLTAKHHEALDYLDRVLRRPELMYSMHLRPGDMQMLNNHVTFHSRTEFTDHDDPALKRCLYRLWLSPPGWRTLPESWRPAYGAIEADTVRGGIVGQGYDDARRGYERRQAAEMGMRAA